MTAATSVITTSRWPVARSNCGPTSSTIILVTREPKILISALEAGLAAMTTSEIAAHSAVRILGIVFSRGSFILL